MNGSDGSRNCLCSYWGHCVFNFNSNALKLADPRKNLVGPVKATRRITGVIFITWNKSDNYDNVFQSCEI